MSVTRESLLAWVTALPPGTTIATDMREPVALVSSRMEDVCFVIGTKEDLGLCPTCGKTSDDGGFGPCVHCEVDEPSCDDCGGQAPPGGFYTCPGCKRTQLCDDCVGEVGHCKECDPPA
jgi:hypothetical protein